MNERIKELAIQAGFGPKWTTDSNPGEPANINSVLVEEFAELILKECIATIEVSSVCFTVDQVRIKQLAVSGIKEHFGVE